MVVHKSKSVYHSVSSLAHSSEVTLWTLERSGGIYLSGGKGCHDDPDKVPRWMPSFHVDMVVAAYVQTSESFIKLSWVGKLSVISSEIVPS